MQEFFSFVTLKPSCTVQKAQCTCLPSDLQAKNKTLTQMLQREKKQEDQGGLIPSTTWYYLRGTCS